MKIQLGVDIEGVEAGAEAIKVRYLVFEQSGAGARVRPADRVDRAAAQYRGTERAGGRA